MRRRYAVRHLTRYRYPEAVPHAQTEARVQPRDLPWQQAVHDEVRLSPEADDRRARDDFFGNRVLYFSIQAPHTESSVTADFTVDLFPLARPDPVRSTMEWRELLAWLDGDQRQETLREARAWTYPSPRLPQVDAIQNYAREVFDEQSGWLPACQALMTRIHQEFRYAPGSTSVDTPVAEAFAQRSGVCQDFAHIMLCGLRGLGLPCRYVSGYLETQPPTGQEKLVGADATHAWVSVFDPTLGWVDYDPTNDLLPRGQHITLGWGRDFSDVIPVKGVVTGGDQQAIRVEVDVQLLEVDTSHPTAWPD